MKRTVAAILLAMALADRPAVAIDFVSTDRFAVATGASISNEVWVQAQSVDIAGTALDDLFLLAGGSPSPAPASSNAPAIQLSGTLKGDVWGAGESITLSGIAARHARLLGFKNTHVEGQVARNLIAVGSTVVIDKQASVEGSAVVAGQDVLIDGTVRGKTRIYGNRVTLSGAFDDEVSIVASDINILPGTHIAGDLRYMMDKDLILDGRVALDGKLVRMEPKVAASSPGLSWSTVLFQIGLCLAAILVGMAFANFFPSMVAMSVQKLAESFWRSLLVGFVAFCLIPMTAFFLIFTLVGLPLSILLIMGYLIMIYLGKIVAALYLGHSILRRRRDRPPASLLAPLMLGLVTLYTVALAPFPIDILVWFSFTLLGLGGLAGAIMDRRTPIMVACPPPSAPTGEAK